jgi:hypothetical protein
MPNRSSRQKKPRDLNKLAASIVDAATNDAPAPAASEPEKNPNAVALGKLGGKKGGPARAKKLTAEQRRAIARHAAESRWAAHKE